MEQDYSIIVGSYYQQMAAEFQRTEEDRRMYIAFNGMNGELKADGNQWCATTGEWPEHNISGFADTPAGAMQNWFSNYCSQKVGLKKVV